MKRHWALVARGIYIPLARCMKMCASSARNSCNSCGCCAAGRPWGCADCGPVQLRPAAAGLVAWRLQRLGVQHGGAGGRHAADALRPVHDRLEVHRWVGGSGGSVLLRQFYRLKDAACGLEPLSESSAPTAEAIDLVEHRARLLVYDCQV